MASFIVQLTLSEIMSHFAGFFPEKCKLLSGRYEGCQKDVKKACRYSGNALKKINNDKSFFHMLSEFGTGVALLRDYRSGKYTNIPWKSISMIAFTIIDILNPFDLIPDITPVIGLIDDAGVMGICLKAVSKDLSVYKTWKETTTRKSFKLPTSHYTDFG